MGRESDFGSDNSMNNNENGSNELSTKSNAVYNTTHELKENIKFKRVEINDSELTEGVVNIYFYPKGNTSGGKVFIINNKEKTFSISVDTITGRVIIAKEEKDF